MESDVVCPYVSDYKIDDCKAGGFVNHEFDYRLTLDETKSTYQLIIKITIISRSTRNKKIMDGMVSP